VGLGDMLERASQLSDKLHSLSTSLTNDLDTHFPPMGKILMPRPSMCHTASLQTGHDK
nr:prolactin I - Japanese eel [Anguilla japonica]